MNPVAYTATGGYFLKKIYSIKNTNLANQLILYKGLLRRINMVGNDHTG